MSYYAFFYSPIQKRRTETMLKSEFTIETLGEPNLQALTEYEQRTFLETLLKRIIELKAQND